MREDTYEYVLYRYPELIEPGLSAISRQRREAGNRYGLFLKDSRGRTVIAELKKGFVEPEDLEAIHDHIGRYRSHWNPDRAMLVAPHIYPEGGGRISSFWRGYFRRIFDVVAPDLPGVSPNIKDWKGLQVYFDLPYDELDNLERVPEAADEIKKFVRIMLPYTDEGIKRLRTRIAN